MKSSVGGVIYILKLAFGFSANIGLEVKPSTLSTSN